MFELALRTTAILLVAWIVARMLARATAATRHLVWHSAILAVLAAPIAGPLAPRFELPAAAAIVGVARVPSVANRAAENAAGPPALPRQASASRVTPAPILIETLWNLIALAWLTGSAILLLRLLIGVLAGAISVRRAAPAPVAWHMEVNALRQRLRISRNVHLRILECDTSPVVTGVWRPTILLPETARGWDAERRRSVLVHELAHVRRGDLRALAIAQAACAIYWFNPLVWFAFAQLRSECEQACDDEVLRSGALPSAYAAHLLDIARELSPALRPSPALAMARSSQLEGRVLAVLAAGRSRVPARGTRWAVTALIGITMTIALGASTRDDARARDVRTATPVTRLVTQPAPAERETGVAPFASALDDSDQDVREKAALALGFSSSPEAIPGLLKALADPHAQVREKAAIGLALRRDARVTSALIAAMDDPDPQVREKAAISLGTSGDSRAAAVLARALRDPDSQVREQAAAGLIVLRSSPQDVEQADRVRNRLGGLAGFLISLAR